MPTLTIASAYSEIWRSLFDPYVFIFILFPLMLSLVVERRYFYRMLYQDQSRFGRAFSFFIIYKNITYVIALFLFATAPLFGLLAGILLLLGIFLIHLTWLMYVLSFAMFLNAYFQRRYNFSVSLFNYIAYWIWSFAFIFTSLAFTGLVDSRFEHTGIHLIGFLILSIVGFLLRMSYGGLKSLITGFIVSNLIMSIYTILIIFSNNASDIPFSLFVSVLLLFSLPIFIPITIFAIKK